MDSLHSFHANICASVWSCMRVTRCSQTHRNKARGKTYFPVKHFSSSLSCVFVLCCASRLNPYECSSPSAHLLPADRPLPKHCVYASSPTVTHCFSTFPHFWHFSVVVLTTTRKYMVHTHHQTPREKSRDSVFDPPRRSVLDGRTGRRIKIKSLWPRSRDNRFVPELNATMPRVG